MLQHGSITRKYSLSKDEVGPSKPNGDASGEEFKDYVFKIMGGYDKQGFLMKQGVLTPVRARLLLVRGTPYFRRYGRRNGERRRGVCADKHSPRKLVINTALNALFVDKASRKPLLLVSGTGLVMGCLLDTFILFKDLHNRTGSKTCVSCNWRSGKYASFRKQRYSV